MSKNLTKHANYDAFESAKDSLTAPHAAAIEDENGTIVGYKGEDGDFVMFQNGEGYVKPKPTIIFEGFEIYGSGVGITAKYRIENCASEKLNVENGRVTTEMYGAANIKRRHNDIKAPKDFRGMSSSYQDFMVLINDNTLNFGCIANNYVESKIKSLTIGNVEFVVIN